MPELYQDGTYKELHPTWHAEDSPWKAAKVASILKRHSIEPATVSEIGCGAGGILTQLSKTWPKAVFDGYEISPQAYEMAQTRATDSVRFHLADMANEATPTFEVLLVMDVVEHVEDYYGFLRKIRDKAEYKVFHIPLDLCALVMLRAHTFMKPRLGLGHIQSFTKDTALATLTETGYEVVDWEYTAGILDMHSRERRARMLHWPRIALRSMNPDAAVRLLGGFSMLVLAR